MPQFVMPSAGHQVSPVRLQPTCDRHASCPAAQTRLEVRQPTYGFGGALSSERRELAAMVEASERYAAEARRLVPTQVCMLCLVCAYLVVVTDHLRVCNLACCCMTTVVGS